MRPVRYVLCLCLATFLVWGQAPSYLGLGLNDLDGDRAKALELDPDQGGVEVTRVQVSSPAGRAGLRPGDVLLAYNGKPIVNAQQVLRLVTDTPLGKRVTLQYWRNGKKESVSLITESRPPTQWPEDSPRPFSTAPDFTIPADVPDAVFIWKNTIIGIESEVLEPQLAVYFGVQRGILVRSVYTGSIADAAGLHAGDVITAAREHPVSNPRDLTSALRITSGGLKPIPLAVIRDRHKLTINIRLVD